jgi:N-acetylmuramoyl-L-alanine amidase
MPKIYLSPSVREYEEYINGGTEDQYMNLIADAMEPYLIASGIDFDRSRPTQTLTEIINQVNSGDYDFYLGIHSSSAPPALAGWLRGTNVYYWYGNRWGREGADIIADNLSRIYPDAEKVKSVATSTMREVRRNNAPSAVVEIIYHDNAEDVDWLKENIDEVARTLVLSLTEYFGIPFVEG